MSEDAHKTTEGAVLIKRIGRNVLNVGIFLVEVLFLILAWTGIAEVFHAGGAGLADRLYCQSTGEISGETAAHCAEAQFLCGDLRCDPADRAGMLLWDHCVVL